MSLNVSFRFFDFRKKVFHETKKLELEKEDITNKELLEKLAELINAPAVDLGKLDFHSFSVACNRRKGSNIWC